MANKASKVLYRNASLKETESVKDATEFSCDNSSQDNASSVVMELGKIAFKD